MRTRLAGLFLAGVAIAGLAIGVSLGTAQAQARDDQAVRPGEPKTVVHHPAHARRHTRATDKAPSVPLPRQKPTTQKADTKPGQPPERPQFTAAEDAAAQIPGMPDARFFSDAVPAFQRALPAQPGPWLVLSTGGEEGAYGAGFLNGWLQTGTRPEFSVITGVSTGALMATYVFAGPQFAEELHQVYTTVSATDIFEVAATPESLVDSWPLAKMIDKRVTPEILAAVAAEYKKGRRLFVLTTDLDAGRTVVWNMGAIAAHGDEAALKLFRQVLLAASSIEAFFPPVYITVEANGRQFQEMHGDGGVLGPLFFGPEVYLVPGSPLKLPASELYVIFNGKLTTEFSETSRSTASILGRTIGLALKAGGRLQLALAAVAAQRANIALNLTSVPDSFDQVGRGLFDPKYMNALYDLGAARGRSDSRFPKDQMTSPPEPAARTAPPAQSASPPPAPVVPSVRSEASPHPAPQAPAANAGTAGETAPK
ncbi:MAG TPA: patatin-like phospholipase family protein [Xanthobacteraceae bacterium]|nr:patatin-like phospholipase family protein [Xanthobacteraceae bacterium]